MKIFYLLNNWFVTIIYQVEKILKTELATLPLRWTDILRNRPWNLGNSTPRSNNGRGNGTQWQLPDRKQWTMCK